MPRLLTCAATLLAACAAAPAVMGASHRRLGDTDADLQSLSVAGGKLQPAFKKEVTYYCVPEPEGTKSVSVTAKADSKAATFTISEPGGMSPETGANGVPISIGIPPADRKSTSGANITVVVTAGDNTHKKTYTLNVGGCEAPKPTPKPSGGSGGSTGLVVSVVVVEAVVITGLVAVLYRQRKQAEAAQARFHVQDGTLQSTVDQPVYRGVILITIGMSAGYASLLLLQHHLMSVMEDNKAAAGHGHHSPSSADSGSWVNDTMEVGTSRRYLKEDCKVDTHWENQFKHAATFNYLGNLIFRLAHNFVFGCVSPRNRVYIALCSMGSAMLIISVGIYLLKASSLFWVYLAYFMGGMGWGTFETNLLSCITPLGHDTKVWAITGIPIGFMTISVLGFWIRSPQPFGVLNCHGIPDFECPEAIHFPRYLYYYVIVALGVGAATFATMVPAMTANTTSFCLLRCPPVSATKSLPAKTTEASNVVDFYQGKEQPLLGAGATQSKESSLVEAWNQWRKWFPLIWVNCFALMVQCFWLSFFVGFPFYIYNGDHVSLVSVTASHPPR